MAKVKVFGSSGSDHSKQNRRLRWSHVNGQQRRVKASLPGFRADPGPPVEQHADLEVSKTTPFRFAYK